MAGRWEVVPASGVEREALRAHVVATWGDETVTAHGRVYRPADLPGFVALVAARIAGHASYEIVRRGCHLISIDAQPRHDGIGTALLAAVEGAAAASGCPRIWLETTNDNLDALRFYQRRGFRLTDLRTGLVDEERRDLKPAIPAVGSYGIPMRDELELAKEL